MLSKALFIVNPAARKLPPEVKLEEAAARLREAGWETSHLVTEAKGHATELARRAAADGCDVAVACGGDGTVNEVVNGIAGTPTALAVVPGGTANVWAKEARLPKDPLRAADVILSAARRGVDLGLATSASEEGSEAIERYFLLMAGIGLDGHVLSEVPGELKRRLGAATYVISGLREALRYRSQPVAVGLDGEGVRLDLSWMLVGNTRSYGGVVNVTRDAMADDGLLDVCAIEGQGWRRVVACGLRILIGRLEGAPGVVWRRVRSVELAAPPSFPVQVDGDYLGRTPMRFRVAPRALTVLVPSDLRSPLFETES